MKSKIFIAVLFCVFISNINAQSFGKNRVQFKEYDWFYIQTRHFDIYFSDDAKEITEFAASASEEALQNIEEKLDYRINNRVAIVVYNSHNDFQETNTTDSYISQGVGGFTEPFKNRVVVPFEGNWEKYRHVIHHELVHAVMRDMLYGGTVQNIITKGITIQLPHWYHEGMAEYLSSDWETNSDQFIRNAIINEFMPDINEMSGYFGYRGGQALFKYIAETYGEKKVGELLGKVQGVGGVEGGFKATIGLSIEELNERFKKYLKKKYWPEIATREEPGDFAKRLTNNKKDGGFYNTSPAISPQGDKVAFISDRNVYMDVYVMNIFDNEKIKRIVESGRTNDFEELNVLFPSLTWSPDNIRLALSGKQNGFDVIYVVDTDEEETEALPFKFDGIESVSWSPDGSKIAFTAHNSLQGDIYIYNFDTEEITNITEDVFSDVDPAWAPDNKTLFFSSDRGDIVNKSDMPKNFNIFSHYYENLDIYKVDTETKEVIRITDWELSDEISSVISPDGKSILFTSDYNGIGNIYRKSLEIDDENIGKSILEIKAIPITNSLNEISQISTSADGKKLVFTSLYKLGYNIFQMDNPFEMKIELDELEPTAFMADQIEKLNNHKMLDSNAENLEELEAESVNDKSKNTETTEEEYEVVSIESKKEEGDDNVVIFSGSFNENSTDSANIKKDYSNYVFGVDENELKEDSTKQVLAREKLFAQKLDENGNYLVNRYKINFTPDLVYANAGYSTFYGVLGTTVLAFSDVLGNHRLIGTTSLQVDLKNSDYGLAYYYLPKKLDIGVEAFHTARFVYLTRSLGSNLFRFRNYGAVVSASYPMNTFHRIEGSFSAINVSSENLDDITEDIDKVTYLIPSVGFVKDNTLWGYYSPIEGERYRLTLFGDPGIIDSKRSFYSMIYDYRKYYRFWYDNSFVFRFSGGFSAGGNPQRFFIGGTENWINRTFASGDIPLENASDFVFLTPALPLRGYDYAERIGTKYSLLNIELRMPFIRYLLTGPLPLLFSNILSTAFIDAGATWNENKELTLFKKNEAGDTVTDDLLVGTGFGARTYFLFAVVRFDVAWKYNLAGFSEPKYYISIGTDF
ncbi:MAG: peptidase MA family metallohydrolase [Ignavibacteria bacterium]|jgi:Tol biopolymer transport system component